MYAFSSFDKGWKSFMLSIFCLTCVKLDISDKIARTPSNSPQKRKAREASAVKLLFFGGLASIPPLTGSIIISKHAFAWINALFQS